MQLETFRALAKHVPYAELTRHQRQLFDLIPTDKGAVLYEVDAESHPLVIIWQGEDDYALRIENHEYESRQLANLETVLYEWGKSEGYFSVISPDDLYFDGFSQRQLMNIARILPFVMHRFDRFEWLHSGGGCCHLFFREVLTKRWFMFYNEGYLCYSYGSYDTVDDLYAFEYEGKGKAPASHTDFEFGLYLSNSGEDFSDISRCIDAIRVPQTARWNDAYKEAYSITDKQTES